LYDLVGQVSDEGSFDLIVSTSGNYHMALSEFWFDHFLPEHPEINSWFYTTSPPVSLPQTARARVTFGNLRLHSRPHVAVGPMSVMDALDEAGVAVSTPVPILKNRGNVLLVRKGNPHGIESIWDLATDGVSVVTSNPATEPGSFGNYTNSIYQIARQDADYAGPLSAEDLFNAIFNADHPGKWLAGTRIHHREVPWSLIHGRGDVAPVFYHLARYFVDLFPDKLEIIPLRATVETPEPIPGNRVATLYAVQIAGDWTPQQVEHQKAFIQALTEDSFQAILQKHHIDIP